MFANFFLGLKGIMTKNENEKFKQEKMPKKNHDELEIKRLRADLEKYSKDSSALVKNAQDPLAEKAPVPVPAVPVPVSSTSSYCVVC